MRFIHTADWHLGRLFYQTSLTEDQAHVLDDLVRLAREEKVDALVVAGDVYDRSVPPADAVRLLDDVLCRLLLDLGIPVIVIAGNHDSPERLGFGSRILAAGKLNMVSSVEKTVHCVTLADSVGPVHFYSMPYAELATIRERFGDTEAPDHQAAVRLLLKSVQDRTHPGQRAVLIGHAFVQGGKETESERPLLVGGADRIDPECFRGFSYVALGHLHRPQTVGGETIHYSGSLLKYSFSEVDHTKVVNMVEIDEKGSCRVEKIPLTPKRDVRRIQGYLRDLLTDPESGKNREDYIVATILDKGAILDVMGKLREVYPNVKHVERPALVTSGRDDRPRVDHRKLNDLQLFDSFCMEMTGEPLSDEQRAAYESVVDDLRRRQREAAS